MSDASRPVSADDLARLLLRLKGAAAAVPSLTGGATTPAGTPPNSGGGFKNPMTGRGSLIKGGEAGAANELPVGAIGQVLLVIDTAGGPDVAWGSAGLDAEAVQDAVAALLVAGTGIALVYDDAAGTLTVSATGGGSGGNGPDYLYWPEAGATGPDWLVDDTGALLRWEG